MNSVSSLVTGGRASALTCAWHSVRKAISFFLICCVLVTFPVIMLRLDLQVLSNGVAEGGAVETSQLACLALCIASLLVLALLRTQERRFAILAAAFFGSMVVRECDFYLNEILPCLWQMVVFIVALAAIIYASLDHRRTLKAAGAFLDTDGGKLMLMGLAVLLVYSRLLGMQDIWIQLLGEGAVRALKNASEEGAELLGYCIISLSVLLGTWQRIRGR